MAVEFLVEANGRVPGKCDAAFGESIEHYSVVRERLRTLLELHPERTEGCDWTETIGSPEGAQLIWLAGEAERKGVAC